MNARIMINCVEYLPRVISETLENEMLTHGTTKMDRISGKFKDLMSER